MATLVNILIAALATGAIYALVAIGFTLLWQTSQTINFAQGEFVMLPAFFMLAAANIGLPFWAAVLIGFAVTMLLLAIATMAFSVFMREAVKEFFTAEAQPFPSIVPATNIDILGAVVSLQNVGALGVAVAAVLALQYLLTRTSVGHQMQATAQNPTVARILGIPVDRMILYTFL